MSNYKCENPCFKFIGTRDGDRRDENALHQKYKEYCIDDTEWMRLPKDVLKELKKMFGKIDKFRYLSDFKRNELLHEGYSSEQIDFLEICLKCSKKPTERHRFNIFYDTKEWRNMLSNYLGYKDRQIREMMDELEEKRTVIKYDDGYFINPNVLFDGDISLRKHMYFSTMLVFGFDIRNHQRGVILETLE